MHEAEVNLASFFPDAQTDESWMQTQWEGDTVKDVFRTRSSAAYPMVFASFTRTPLPRHNKQDLKRIGMRHVSTLKIVLVKRGQRAESRTNTQ